MGVSVGNTKEGRILFSFGVCGQILPLLQVSCVELGDSDNDRIVIEIVINVIFYDKRRCNNRLYLPFSLYNS